MDINIFSEQQNTADIISKESDGDKFQKITTILCQKRKELEEDITSNPSQEKTERLLLHVQEMLTFGITEFDYQKYLATKNK